MITSSTSALIASVMAAKSSISYDGVPSGFLAWMWIIDPPSSTTRLASAAYSSGVYGMAGHWSRLATVPLMLLVIITGSLKLMMELAVGSSQLAGARFARLRLLLSWPADFEAWWRTRSLPIWATSCMTRSA